MSSEEEKNKVLVRRFWEAQANADLDTLDELLAPDFVDHGLLPDHDPGREGFVQGVAEAHDALSFIRTTIEYQGTDGDDMVIPRHTTRTIRDRGAYLGLMASTDQERETRGMVIHRVSGGKIVEEWSFTCKQWEKRRGWDSNPRDDLTPPTRFPIALLRPTRTPLR